MTLVVLKIHDGIKEVFTELVCQNATEDPDADWMRVLCFDCEDESYFEVDASQILDIQKYET